MSIVEFAQEEADRRGAGRVTAVHLRLGAFSGVVKEALLTSYEMACDGTSLAGSRLIVEDIPLVIYCAGCDARHPVDPNQWFSCSVCGAPTPEIVQGKELEVSALEIED